MNDIQTEHLKFTGERLTTELKEHFGITEHLNRYSFAARFINKKVVLDLACGEGYGSNHLAALAESVVGVDIDEGSILHAKGKYKKKNLTFVTGSVTNIPVLSDSIDVIVCFETIEHLTEHDKMMYEFKRVLKRNGILIISSPEKSIYQERDPNNPYHLKELSFDDFRRLLNTHFEFSSYFSQRLIFGAQIEPVDQASALVYHDIFSGDFNNIKIEYPVTDFYLNKAYFNLAICSNESISEALNVRSFFDGHTFLKAQHDALQNLKLRFNKLPHKRLLRGLKRVLKIFSK